MKGKEVESKTKSPASTGGCNFMPRTQRQSNWLRERDRDTKERREKPNNRCEEEEQEDRIGVCIGRT